MTAVMRSTVANVAPGPRVLRIGVVEGGRVREERVLGQGASVTIGPSERAMFIAQAAGLPPVFELFERRGQAYYLCLAPGMSARVAAAGVVRDLRGAATPERFRLDDDARGKIVCGETTFLFQLALPPAAPPRPHLPLAVKNGLAGSIDWSLTILVALSFLVHFGVIGAMYSDWADPIVDEDVTAGGLIDMVTSLPTPDPEQPEPSVDSAPAEASSTAAPPPTAAPSAPSAAEAAGSRARAADAHLRQIAAQAEALHFELLGVARSGTAVDGVLTRGELPAVDLTAVAPSDVGAVARASGDLRIATRDGLFRPGSVGPRLTDIATTHQSADITSGKEARTTGPRVDALLEPLIPTVPVSHAEDVIRALRPGFRHCYMQGLDADGAMGGKVVLVAQIAPNGEVSGIEVQSNTGLSSKVVQCLARKVQGAQFERAGANGSKLAIPITLVQQAR